MGVRTRHSNNTNQMKTEEKDGNLAEKRAVVIFKYFGKFLGMPSLQRDRLSFLLLNVDWWQK